MKKRNRKTENTVQSSNALHGVFSIFSSLQGLGEMTVPTLSGLAEMLMRMGAALVLPTFIGQSGVFFAEGAAWVCAAALNLVWYYMRIGKIKREMMQ